MKSAIVNFVLFQLGWFACVGFGGTPYHAVGTAIVAIVVIINLRIAAQPASEMKLVAFAITLGLIWESAISYFGVVRYEYGQLATWLAPHWILALWALFATTINGSLTWLKNSWSIAVLLGAIGGPISFYAGQRLGAVTMPDFNSAMIILAIGWGVMTPMLIAYSNRLEKHHGRKNFSFSVPADSDRTISY